MGFSIPNKWYQSDQCLSAQDKGDVESMVIDRGIKAKKKKKKKFRYDARDRLMTARVHRSKWSRQGSWMIRYCSCTRPTTIERRRLDGRQWRGNGELDEFSRGCARQPATAHGVATVTKSS